MNEVDTLIIGAGLAGLTLARELSGHPGKVMILEKSKSPGGRLSTRLSDFGSFDHGAQYLTSRTPAFTALLNQLSETGKLAPWSPAGKGSSRPWWVGQPGMSTLGKALARGLDISFETRVTEIACEDGGFVVHTQDPAGEKAIYAASRIVAAIPAPQAMDLLVPLDPVFLKLQEVSMAPCWSAMLAFESRLNDLLDLTRGKEGDVLSLIARNGSKPGRDGETFVIHATPEWSRAHIENDPDTVKSAMVSALRQQTGLGDHLPAPVHCKVHRWLYALAETPLDQPFFGNSGNTLFACGDWCIGGRAEAAHQSGLALAQHIISL
ncbi:FAD-dependent oxidoreductase [Hoeflea sp. AS60]|uniref:NAD(P)/FAD-dependent oxidoreductase n=1 Tax=Hoeflea sp. AS60 TaxID=3135780 RepID=UPI0031754BC3